LFTQNDAPFMSVVIRNQSSLRNLPPKLICNLQNPLNSHLHSLTSYSLNIVSIAFKPFVLLVIPVFVHTLLEHSKDPFHAWKIHC